MIPPPCRTRTPNSCHKKTLDALPPRVLSYPPISFPTITGVPAFPSPHVLVLSNPPRFASHSIDRQPGCDCVPSTNFRHALPPQSNFMCSTGDLPRIKPNSEASPTENIEANASPRKWCAVHAATIPIIAIGLAMSRELQIRSLWVSPHPSNDRLGYSSR